VEDVLAYFLEPCPKLVLSDRAQLAYDFLLHRRKLMMSIYHKVPGKPGFVQFSQHPASSLLVFETRLKITSVLNRPGYTHRAQNHNVLINIKKHSWESLQKAPALGRLKLKSMLCCLPA
jgi:hypothetical protein